MAAHPQSPERRAASGAPIPARAGIGLRFTHQARILAQRPAVGWLEAHPENYLGDGPAVDDLLSLRRDYPLSLHATGLSLGSADGIDQEHLTTIADLAKRLEPGLISDHLSWSVAGGAYLPDLLPLPYTDEALAVFACNLDRVQTALGRAILVENPSTYLAFTAAQLSEAEFLGALVRRSGCGVLLDINNIYVSAMNLGDSPGRRLIELLSAIPPAAVGEIHLAGHLTRPLPGGGAIRIDDHGSEVRPEVWALFETAIRLLGPRPALIEWDTDIPALEVLLDQARIADQALILPETERRRAGAR